MKRVGLFVLSLSLCVMLSSCKSRDATAADNLISAIGEVTLDSESDIVQAEAAVNALNEKNYNQLEYLEQLKTARKIYDDLVDQDTAKQITETFEHIADNVTLESEDTIKSARHKYDNSADNVKKYISNYENLIKAEEILSSLKIENVTNAISEIGTVGLNSGKSIIYAQVLYSNLSADEKNNIPNYDLLKQAKDTFSKLQSEQQEKEEAEKAAAAKKEREEKEAVSKKAISKMNTKTDKVEGITWYQSPNEPYYVNSRSFVLPYIGKSASSVWLRLKFHYTGDNWIFWEKLTIMVDGIKYYKYYDFYDVVRDNGNGDVWEYIDIAPDSSDIKMLEAIANSTETIVRFEGDTYHYDLTIKNSDKTAIKDVLAAYAALKNS